MNRRRTGKGEGREGRVARGRKGGLVEEGKKGRPGGGREGREARGRKGKKKGKRIKNEWEWESGMVRRRMISHI